MEQFNGIVSDSGINKTGGKHMNDEIKTEDIINSLRICTDFTENCSRCAFNNLVAPNCRFAMGNAAVDQLKQLSNQHIKIQYNNEELTISEMCSRMDELRKKANAARLENELLRGALAEMNETYDRTSCDERIMRQAIETYGVQSQCDVAIEEMAELTQVVMKIRRISDGYEETMAARDHLIDEIADVGIMIDQMEMMFDAVDVEKMRRKKLLRLKKRLELEGADEK